MSERSYASALVEESLGLVSGALADGGHVGSSNSDSRFVVPQKTVSRVAETMRGGADAADTGSPFLEREFMALLDEVRRAELQRDGFFVRKARWPGGSMRAVCLTHDVDNVSRPLGHLWRTRSRFSPSDVLGGVLGLRSPYDNVGLIAAKEEAAGFRSSFYFLSSNYPLRALRKTTDRIRAAGWDVGLHGDFGTHDSLEKMNEALSAFSRGLGFKPGGLREHYLKFDFSKSWPVMEAAGFDYDTTVGTNDRLGFKLGLASPFHPPDAAWKPMELLEIPLILMDTTLWGYLKKTEAEGLRDSLRMLETVEGVEGLFTLLWHQEAVRMKGGRLYWRLLDEFKQRGCYVGSGADIARWWRDRGAVPLIKRGRLISLGGRPPPGLTLRLTLRDGLRPRVSSGSAERLAGEGEYAVRVQDADFTLEVEGTA